MAKKEGQGRMGAREEVGPASREGGGLDRRAMEGGWRAREGGREDCREGQGERVIGRAREGGGQGGRKFWEGGGTGRVEG